MAADKMKVNKEEKGSIPKDIDDFFSRGGRSLILRGAPGTGKTTLAMEILDGFKSDGESIFISARIDEQAIKSHLRWVDFDMLLSKGKDDGSRNRKKGRISRTELDRLESRVEDGDETLESDYDPEPGSGKVDGDTWTIDITALLPEIDRLYEKLEAELPPKAVVAIDSIDSLAEKYGIAPRRLIHTIQKDLVERSNINAIFILETTDSNTLDYMGDGVISLEMDDIGGRRLRLMRLEKMRGQSITNPVTVFSLANGRFASFSNPLGMESANPSVHTVPEIRPGELLAGITEPGKYTLLELDSSVPVGIVRGLARAISQSASSEGGIYTTPSLRLFGPRPSELLEPAIKQYAEKVKIISPAALLRQNSMDAGSVRVDGDSFLMDFDDAFIDSLFPEVKKRLFLMDANQLISHYGHEAIKDMENHIAHLLRGGGICIGFTWPSSNPVDMDMGMSDRLVKVTTRGPNVIFYGEKPYSSAYVLAMEEKGVLGLRAVL